jgi:hypothetical protein
MPVQYFLLDSNAAGYAAALAALATLDAAKYFFTPTQTLRDVAADTDIKVVKANVAEAELDAHPDLADLRLTNGVHVPTALCRGRFRSLNQFRTFGFHALGESIRSSEGVAGRSVRYFAQTGSGAEDGTTPYDAIGGFDASDVGEATWALDTTNVVLGCLYATWNVAGGSPESNMPGFQNAEGNEIRFRADYMGNPGMVFPNYCYQTSAWTRPDPTNHPRVWRNTSYVNPWAARFLLPFDPRATKAEIYTNSVFAAAASQAECESTPMSLYNAGGTELWVHMPDDSNPSERIGQRLGGGWNLVRKATVDSASTPYDGIEFINFQCAGASVSTGGAMCPSTNRMFKGSILGGRYLMGCSFKPKQQPNTHPVTFGRSTDGDICWDTSERPAPDTDEYIQNLIDNHGSDAAVWAEIDRFVEIDSSTEGIYYFGGGFTDVGDNTTISGVLFEHIGTRHAVLQSKLGGDGYDDLDSHAIAGQGNSNCTFEFFYTRKAGACVVLYANGDATNTQNQRNNTFQDFVIVDNHARATGAGGWGIDLTGNGNWAGVRTAGPNGLVDGNIIRRGHIENIHTGYGGSPPIDGGAISLYCYQEIQISDVTMKGCDHCFLGGNTNLTDSTYAEDPAYIGPQYNVSNCVMQTPTFYFLWHRNLNWSSSSPPNLGYYRFDNNSYVYPSGGNLSTDTYWRFVSTEQTFAAWQANTKGSPPGAEASIYDPNSTIELAA